jgi:hypothetical protein
MSYRSIISIMPKTSFDADAQAVINAIEGTGVTLSSIEKAACNTLITDFKNYGLWTKSKAIYGFLGGTASAHKFNWKDPRDLDAAFRLQFFGGITHDSNGIKGNASNGYANTFIAPSSNLTQDSTHLSFYSRTNVSSTQVEISALGGNPNRITLEISWLGSFDSDLYNFSTGRVTSANANSTGFYVASRINSTTHKAFKNNSQLGSTNTGASGSLSNITNNLVLLAQSASLNFSSKQCAFSSIGDGLTDTDAANLYTAVQTFQTSLARNI